MDSPLTGPSIGVMTMSEERCVCCGEIIPEGRHVCVRCEAGSDDECFMKVIHGCAECPVKDYCSRHDKEKFDTRGAVLP